MKAQHPIVFRLLFNLSPFEKENFIVLERSPGVSVDEIRNATAGKLIVEGEIPEMVF